MNPALSLSFAICGLMTCARALFFILAEIAASITAAVLFKGLRPSKYKENSKDQENSKINSHFDIYEDEYVLQLPVTSKSEYLTIPQECAWEILISILLVFVYLACVNLRQLKSHKWMLLQFGKGILYTVIAILYSIVCNYIYKMISKISVSLKVHITNFNVLILQISLRPKEIDFWRL